MSADPLTRGAGPRRVPAAYWLALALITIWFGSRWPAAWYAYPFEGFQDEPYLVDVAHAMVRDRDPNPHFFNYPSLSFYLLSAVFAVGDATGRLPLAEGALAPASPDHYVWARLFVLALATLAVPLTGELARRLFGSRAGPLAGIGAAATLAVTPVFSSFSYLATVNPLMSLWAALAGLAALRTVRDGSVRAHVLAGIAVGLALGTKYVTFPVALLVPALELLAWLGWGLSRRPPRWRALLAFGLAAGLVLLATTPYALLDHEQFRRDLARTGDVYDLEGRWHFHEGEGPASWGEIGTRFATRSFLLGPSLALLAGLAWAALRRPLALLLALPLLLTWAFLGSYKVFFPRNLLGALPFACALAGAGLFTVVPLTAALLRRLAGDGRWSRTLGFVAWLLAATAVLYQPLTQARAGIAADLRIDTRRAALDWIREHAPPGARLVREERTPPLEELLEGYEVLYVRSIARPDRTAEAEGCDFALLTVPFRRDVRQVEDYARDRELYDAFMARHRLAADFDPREGDLTGRRIAIYALDQSR